jgi:hypothetical protein
VLGGAGAAVLAIVGVVIAVAGSGSGGSSGPSTASSNGPSTAGSTAVGIVPGKSIGPLAIGQPRSAITATMVAAGYPVNQDSIAGEGNYGNQSRGYWVVEYRDRTAWMIQRYGDGKISIAGVTVSSTLAQAEQRLPTWQVYECPRLEDLLVSPDRHTYWLIARRVTAQNYGSNGIIVSQTPVDQTFCGS